MKLESFKSFKHFCVKNDVEMLEGLKSAPTAIVKMNPHLSSSFPEHEETTRISAGFLRNVGRR